MVVIVVPGSILEAGARVRRQVAHTGAVLITSTDVLAVSIAEKVIPVTEASRVHERATLFLRRVVVPSRLSVIAYLESSYLGELAGDRWNLLQNQVLLSAVERAVVQGGECVGRHASFNIHRRAPGQTIIIVEPDVRPLPRPALFTVDIGRAAPPLGHTPQLEFDERAGAADLAADGLGREVVTVGVTLRTALERQAAAELGAEVPPLLRQAVVVQ